MRNTKIKMFKSINQTILLNKIKKNKKRFDQTNVVLIRIEFVENEFDKLFFYKKSKLSIIIIKNEIITKTYRKLKKTNSIL